MAAICACQHHDRHAFHDEQAANVLTLRTRNRKGTIGIGHAEVRIVDPSAAACLDGIAVRNPQSCEDGIMEISWSASPRCTEAK